MGGASVIVLDTHALIWWVDNPDRLSQTARHAIDSEFDAGDAARILISAITAWEIAMLINKGRLSLSMDLEVWLDLVADIDGLRFIPMDREIAVAATRLPGEFHKDPADRIIVSTARKYSAPVVTGDEKILKYTHVKAVW
jgi:PIN domain nuclease of toxin-antitoxin system